jgi:peptide-methionine (S)-S-oxide reductase
MFPFSKKLEMPVADNALPGRSAPIPTARQHFVNGHPLKGPYPEGLAMAMFGLRLLLGRRAQILGAWRRHLRDRGRLCRRLHAQSHLRGGVQRAHRPQRSRARRLRPEENLLRAPAQGLLGKPRPDPGHAARQRRRHAIPLRHLHLFSPAQRAAAEASRAAMPRRSRPRAMGAITTEIREAPPFYFAEDYHQQYLAKNPHGYCGLGGTGVSCQIGTGVIDTSVAAH